MIIYFYLKRNFVDSSSKICTRFLFYYCLLKPVKFQNFVKNYKNY